MKKESVFVLGVFFMLMIAPMISAIPGIPHQIYGEITVNGQPAPDNNIVSAEIFGQEYKTVTYGGSYGLSPNVFFVEDPNSENTDKTVTVKVGGMVAGSFEFTNNGFDNLDFDLNTTCGDGACLGFQENCDLCTIDCGECATPTIKIISPEEKTYTENKIDLNVISNQNIIVWLYSLNSADFITFQPNITLTIGEGTNNIEVMGVSTSSVGSDSVSFEIDLPEICGDGVCNGAESCSNCATDCSSCGGSSSSSSGGSSGGGSSSSSSSSGSGVIDKDIVYISDDIKNPDENNAPEKQEEETETHDQNSPVSPPGFFSSITGAAIAVGDSLGIFKSILSIIFILAIFIGMVVLVRKRRTNHIP